MLLPGEALGYWLCGRCSLVFMDPAHHPTEERERRRYLQHHNVLEPAYLAYLSRLALPVTRHLPPESRGLDYGSGPVEGMKAILEPLGFAVDSYDPYFFPRPELLNFRYDFVLCCEAAEHFFSPRAEFARIDAVLKKGGLLGVSSALLPPLDQFEGWSYRRDYTHVAFFSPTSVRWLAGHFGWELLSLESPLWILRKTKDGNGGG